MKKWFCILLAVCFIAALPLTVSAEEDAQWEMSEDEKKLYYGDFVYELYPMGVTERFCPDELYEYGVYLSDEYGDTFYFYGDVYMQVVVLTDSNPVENAPFYRVYVSSYLKGSLDSFMNGKYEEYRILDEENLEIAPIPEYVVKSFRSSCLDVRQIKVKALKNAERYDILGYDNSGCFARRCGAVYVYNESYWYVPYDTLDSSCFDDDGNFSYRDGSVTGYKIRDDVVDSMQESLLSLKDWEIECLNPDSLIQPDLVGREGAAALFIILTAIFGYLLPALPVVFGLIFAFSKKTKAYKRWIVFAACGLLWMLVATAILLVLMI